MCELCQRNMPIWVRLQLLPPASSSILEIGQEAARDVCQPPKIYNLGHSTSTLSQKSGNAWPLSSARDARYAWAWIGFAASAKKRSKRSRKRSTKGLKSFGEDALSSSCGYDLFEEFLRSASSSHESCPGKLALWSGICLLESPILLLADFWHFVMCVSGLWDAGQGRLKNSVNVPGIWQKTLHEPVWRLSTFCAGAMRCLGWPLDAQRKRGPSYHSTIQVVPHTARCCALEVSTPTFPVDAFRGSDYHLTISESDVIYSWLGRVDVPVFSHDKVLQPLLECCEKGLPVTCLILQFWFYKTFNKTCTVSIDILVTG